MATGRLSAEVPGHLQGSRFDVALAHLSGRSRSQCRILITDGTAWLSGEVRPPAQRVQAGDRIEWEDREPVHLHAQPEAMALDIVYEDEDLLVVNKPRGLVVHPAPGHPGGTIVNAVLGHVHALPGGSAIRPGIVHRLDRDTSGLMLVAKSEAAFTRLQAMIAGREVRREYDALVHGQPRADSGTIDRPIGRHPKDRKRFTTIQSGRPAVTHWEVRERFPRHSWMHLRLETGRTHQIRVHLREAGWPVVGDPVYGPDRDGTGQLLHAVRLSLRHPVRGEPLCLEAPWPEDMQQEIARLRRAAGGMK